MSDSTSQARSMEVPWLVGLLEAASALAVTGVEVNQRSVVAWMAEKYGVESEANQAWLEACDVLARLAAAPFATADTALEEERTCVHGALRAARSILAYRLQHRLREADEHGMPPACTGCTRTAAAHERRTRSWESVTGPLVLERRYFYCAHCKQGLCPAERVVGLPRTAFTAFYEDRCTRMATLLPHRKAVTEVTECFGIEPGVTTVEAMVARRAAAVQTIQLEAAATLAPYDAMGLPRTMPPESPPDSPTRVDVAYVELDGVLPITRARIDPIPSPEGANDNAIEPTPAAPLACPSPGRGGVGRKYELVSREVKNAVLYEGSHCAPESASRGCITEKRYVSHLGTWRDFAVLLWVQIVRLRFHRARLLVVLSDGAEWVRSLAAWLPVPVLLILDLFHVKHRVWEVAHAVFGDRTTEATTWAHAQND